MTTTLVAPVFLAVALTIVLGGGMYLAFAGVRARRRSAWELDRARWRRWMSRP